MSFARVQSTNRELNQMQSNIAAAFLPLQNNPICYGVFLNDVNLASGSTTIQTGLGRPIQGYLITSIDGAATIYNAAFDGPNLTLTSSAAVTVNLYIF